MSIFLKAYRTINNLSIDVSLGAVICAWFFSSVMDVSIRVQAFIILGITVWVIYTVDHLMDARKLVTTASTERHRFHQENFKVLRLITIIAFFTAAALAFYLRPAILKAGFVLAIFVLLYLLGNKKLRLSKELVGAFFYTGGIVLPSLAISQFNVDLFTIILMMQFMLTAWINMLLFSWLDQENDLSDKRVSFTTVAGVHVTKIVLIALFLSCLFATVYQLLISFNWPVVILAVMDVTLFIIFFFHSYFLVNDRYRFLGDAVFLFPLSYAFVG